MTTKRRTVPLTEVRSILDTLKGEYGLSINSVDIREDGVTVSCMPFPLPTLVQAPPVREKTLRNKFDDYFAAQD